MDFRPLRFDEWEEKVNQVVFVSATPGDEEMELAGGAVVPLVTRPYGQLDPLIEVEPREGHLTHLVGEIHKRIAVNEGILVMATTKRQAEDVAAYLAGQSIRCEWLHEELERDKRKSFLDGLQEGRLDAIVGVALLREGINLPRVSLVAVLDADDTKAGLFRCHRSLIQMIGRAARHANGKAILYADRITGAMIRAIDETRRRRERQENITGGTGVCRG
jgi:excinuclease ABC subunit B